MDSRGKFYYMYERKWPFDLKRICTTMYIHLADRDLNIYSGELELGIPSINQIPPQHIFVTVPLARF